MSARRRPSVLALVRHGESVWITEGRFQGRADSPLSELGLRQAAAVAQRMATPHAAPALPLPPGPPQAIWHSPLQRAAQTAAAIAGACGPDAPLIATDALTELGQGEWEGLPHAVVRERYADELAAWRADPLHNHAPGGESLTDALERARSATQTILGDGGGGAEGSDRTPAEPVLGYERHGAASEANDVPAWSVVVAHDGLLRLLMLDLLGISIERFWSLPFALASVSVIDLQAGFARLRAHNLDEHIAALDR
jgi:broad specificity phosphatase PhoE